MNDRYEEKKDKRERAQDMLRRSRGDAQELFDLAEELKSMNEFGYARRLLGRATEQPIHEQKLKMKIGQRHALCTYKDPDLPVYDKLIRALEILHETDDLKATRDNETLGLAGAIYKRMWQVDTDKEHLERSFAYYNRGFEQGPETDFGYTGINAAYVLDLLASLEERYAVDTGTSSPTAEARRKNARAIRQTLVEVLPSLADSEENKWLTETWWFLVTIAEAHFGLGNYQKASEWLQHATQLEEKPPLWEFESTAVQLASLALIQPGVPQDPKELETTQAWRVLNELLDNKADAVRTIFAGKFGLALSGGGFRASFYHIGVLAKLAELDLLRHVHVLSCVSGGSIVGAHYYLEVRKLLQEKNDSEDDAEAITRQDYVEIVERLQRNFLAGVQRNIRMRVGGNLFANFRMAFSPTYSRTARAGELFEKELYSLVNDGGGSERYLNDLNIEPEGDPNFNPKEHNWLRHNKVPMLVLNATTLNTGHNWQFTTSWMGESPFSIDPEVDCNWRYRRMYYDEAPEKYRQIRLGVAVGASACVPGLFEPIALPDLYPKDDQDRPYPDMTVRLVDGGVHDNQGVASLLEQDCTAIFISDASGQMMSEAEPKGGVLGPLLRMNSTLMERVRQAQFTDLKARERASLLRSFVVVHLKKELEVDPVSWKRCKEPPDLPLRRRTDLLQYGVLRKIQESLAAIRTDLDSFSEIEAYALMTSGYLMTETYADGIRSYRQYEGNRHSWEFLKIESALSGNAPTEKKQDTVEELLGLGAKKFFKVWYMSPVLKGMAAVLAVIAVGLLLLAVVNDTEPSYTLIKIDLDWLASFALWTVVTLLLGQGVVKVLRYKETLKKVLKDIAMAVFGWIATRVHLLFFDPLFLRKGKIDKIL